MKKAIVFLLSILPTLTYATEYTRLIPPPTIPPNSTQAAANYGVLLKEALKWINLAAETQCNKKINADFEREFISAQSKISNEAIKSSKDYESRGVDYQVIIDATSPNCGVTFFKHSGGRPAVLHKPGQKIRTYVLKVYPPLVLIKR